MAKFVNKQATITYGTLNTSSFGTATRIGTSLSSLTTDKAHVLIGCNVANIVSQTVTVDIAIVTDGGTGDDTFKYIAKSVSIPVGGSIELVTGKIVIDADTKEIHGICSVANGADVVMSVLENT